MATEGKQVTLRLHPAQRDFVASDSAIKGFVGGIGSGKSFAGALNLIQRAKPGRLYMAAAPTYVMLSDSTMRSLLAVADLVGVLDRKRVKYNPPSVKLLTGAEVILRSTDEPSRLYGSNLSGLWLDESSLMPVEVFQVGLGRLREG